MSNSTNMTLRGGAILARALIEKGVEHVFTLSGGFCNPALEGFMECGMRVINCPHEQVAGHLADAHTRITRKPAVCLVGPEGFANAVPAMMEAWGERSPVIFVTGSSTAWVSLTAPASANAWTAPGRSPPVVTRVPYI